MIFIELKRNRVCSFFPRNREQRIWKRVQRSLVFGVVYVQNLKAGARYLLQHCPGKSIRAAAGLRFLVAERLNEQPSFRHKEPADCFKIAVAFVFSEFVKATPVKNEVKLAVLSLPLPTSIDVEFFSELMCKVRRE